MNSPFGSSNQGGFRQQPQQQNFSQQGGFGVQTAGTFGGFQPQQQSFGFGGGQGFGGFQPQQSFGGFGGGQGFGGFNPFQGGFGGFQPQQQFNPFQGGYGGGFNPMFGGIGGLGFNPMMGPQFGMPMQGFNPYQIQMMDKQRQFEQQQFNADQTPVMGDMMYRGGRDTRAELPEFRISPIEQEYGPIQFSTSRGGVQGPANWDSMSGQQKKAWFESQGLTQEDFRKNFSETDTRNIYGGSPFTGPQRSAQDILNMAVGNTPKDMQYDLNKDGKITSADALAYRRKYEAQLQQPAADTSVDAFKNSQDYKALRNFFDSPMQYDKGDWNTSFNKKYEDWKKSQPVQPTPQQLNVGVQAPMDAGGMAPESPGLGRLPYDPEYERPAGYGTTQPAVPQRAQQTIADYRRQPMYGGIGGLGFNPMMGPQFGMPIGNFGYYR